MMTEDEFMGNLYQRFPVTVARGEGAHVWDEDGKMYIDCMGRLWRPPWWATKTRGCLRP